MNTARLFSALLLALLVTTLTSCELAGDIFKGGIWIGAIGVLFVVAIVWWLVSKAGGGSGSQN